MTRVRLVLLVLLAASIVTVMAVTARPAFAAGSAGCRLPGYVSTAGSRACSTISGPADSSQFLGPIGGFATDAIKGLLSGLAAWAEHGAATALKLTVPLIAQTTRPALLSSWFSATYWRMGALSTVLAVPFLIAACVHALVRGDLGMIARAAFGYLPLAALGVAIAAPLTTLALTATDEMCAFVSAASSQADAVLLERAAGVLSEASLLSLDPFLVFDAALVTVGATLMLWLELLVRGAAVEVVVLMLPLFFAAMVWPARRVWAIRAVETLVALILSKFAIVAVLTLGGAAITHATSGPSALLMGATIVSLAVLSPWALLRLLPLHEIAAAAAGGLSRAPMDAATRARDRIGRHLPSSAREGEPAEAPPADAPDALLGMLARGGDALRRGVRPDDESDGDVLDPVTSSGLEAVTHPDRRPSAAGAATAAAVAVAAGVPADGPDGRPPIEAPFGDVEWKDFVIADEGDERMAPPVFDDPPAAADEPEPPAPLQPSPSPSSDADPLRPPEERR